MQTNKALSNDKKLGRVSFYDFQGWKMDYYEAYFLLFDNKSLLL